MRILIFNIGFQEKVKNYFLFSVIFPKFLTFYPKTPIRPNSQSANMANFEAFLKAFRKIYFCKYRLGDTRQLRSIDQDLT